MENTTACFTVIASSGGIMLSYSNKSNLYYTRGITAKRMNEWRGPISAAWRMDNTVPKKRRSNREPLATKSDLKGPGIEPD